MKEGLKTPFRQKTASGCGSYALANLFNDRRFIDNIESLVLGEGVVDLNKKLSNLNTPFFLDAVFVVPSNFTKQPGRLIDPLIFQINYDEIDADYRENFARPFVATIKGSNDKFHCVLIIHNFIDDTYYIVDSMWDFVMVMKLDELMQTYVITAIEYVCSWDITDKDDRSIFIRKSFLTHIIP